MKKFYSLAFLVVFITAGAYAQSYSFSASSGTFTALSGGTTITLTDADGNGVPNDEGFANAIPIGFSFAYNNVPYTTLNANTNGFIAFGSAFVSNTNSNFWLNNLTSGPSIQTNVRPIVAPLWDDHEITGGMTYQTSGTAPNRVFTIQWLDVLWRFTASSPSISFQVKLYETTNVIEFVYRQEAGALGTLPTASIGLTASGTGTDNFISLNGSSASPTVSTTTETANIATRPATGQVYTFTPISLPANDISVSSVSALGRIPLAFSGNQAITAVVKNNSATTKTNVSVTLNVTGANTYTNTQTVASLASGASTTVTFSAFSPTATGNNTVTVSVPADDNLTNNSRVFGQVVTYMAMSYFDTSALTNSVGYNLGSGLMLARYNVTGTGYVKSVGVAIGGGTGNTVYAVVLDAAGAIIGQSANYVIQAADSGRLVTFPITTPPAVTNQDFYVGLAQTANTVNGYYPVATQTETPTKNNAYYTAPLAGGTTTAQTTFGRFVISANIETTLPVTLTSFSGERVAGINKLKWTTATEANNQGFEIERSLDGKTFSKISFVGSKGDNGNSSTALTYNYSDEKSSNGTNYYRLKQIDKDGKYSYSSVVMLKGENTRLEITSLYPNPAKDVINVAISSPKIESAALTVTDITGKILMRTNTSLVKGDNFVQMNTSSLATGTYYIRLISNDEVKTVQFVKN